MHTVLCFENGYDDASQNGSLLFFLPFTIHFVWFFCFVFFLILFFTITTRYHLEHKDHGPFIVSNFSAPLLLFALWGAPLLAELVIEAKTPLSSALCADSTSSVSACTLLLLFPPGHPRSSPLWLASKRGAGVEWLSGTVSAKVARV